MTNVGGSVEGLRDRVQAVVPLIAELAADAEQQRKPADEVIDSLKGTGIFRAFVPAALPPKPDAQDSSGAEALEGTPVRYEAHMANLQPGARNEWNEVDGHLTSDVTPHVFVNGGKTGSAMDNTVGGRGGSGDQGVADITVVAPQYESRAPAGAGAQARGATAPHREAA